MSLVGVYLWKEWRDQRAGLLRLAVALAALALCALLLPQRVAGDELFVAGFVGAALAAYALSVGSDLLAGELARDRVRFLERLPGGLSAAFAGKLAFLAASGVAVALLGLALALGVSRARAGALPAWPSVWSEQECLFLVLLGVAVLAWTFATSTWVPRSALALPMSLVLLALLGWPFFLFAGPVPWYAPARGEVELCALSCLLGAPLAGWASFALGCRHGGGPGRALLAGSGVAALALLPSWTWTAAHAYDLWTLEPGDADFRIEGARVDEDGRLLFATCSRELPYGRRMDGGGESMPFAVVVDLASGAWEATRGATARELWPAAGLSERRGLGYHVPGGTYDPFRRRAFTAEDLEGAGGELLWPLVREGHWAAYDAEQRRWVALDPETGKRADIVGLLDGESVCAVVSDGRLLVSGGGAAALLAPESGARRPLAFDDGYAEPVQLGFNLRSADAAVLHVDGETWSGLARLDLERAVLRRAAGASGPVRLVSGSDGDTVYVLEDERRVVRVTFGTDERLVVFPR